MALVTIFVSLMIGEVRSHVHLPCACDDVQDL